jgi:DNA mismatch endonuclease (patch repair protein)
MDVHSTIQRSKNMSAIKSVGTKAEIKLAKALWSLGYRYRKNNKTIFGKPDLTFKSIKLAIFIDSEFFHGKDFETKKKPATNAAFWQKKIERNIQRDKEVNEHLENSGWTVLRFWSEEIRKNLNEVVTTIERHIILKKSKVIKIYPDEDSSMLSAAEPNPGD